MNASIDVHALRLANVMRLLRPRVPEDKRSEFDVVVAVLDQSIDKLFAIDRDIGNILAVHLLSEHGIVVSKAACDALESIAEEARKVATIAGSIASGYPTTSAERRRLRRAEYQIRGALQIARQ